MKRLVAIFCGSLAAAAVYFAATTASASSDTDPLVTLSYLEKIAFPKLKEEITEEISESVNDGEAFSGAEKSYSVIELEEGQQITAKSVCEIIVRPGSEVVCVSPFPKQGIADITLGTEVLDGEEISINSYCIIPRGNDGRGIEVLSEKAYIMIRGDYEIV